MDIKGLRVVFLGDSITQGVGASCIENSLTNTFSRLTGAIAYNLGISGTRIAAQRNKIQEIDHLDFVSRVDTIPPEADIIVVFGGTNDFGHGDAPFGSFTDDTTDSFCGALNVLCGLLKENHPQARIIFMTPLHRVSENATVNEIGISCMPLRTYVNAIVDICARYGFYVLDLFRLFEIDITSEEQISKYIPDGLHPSDEGVLTIVRLLSSFIEEI